MAAMKHGQKSMKKLSKNMKIEDVEATLDNIRDQVEDHEEITLAMSEGIGQNEMLDEGELEDELAELEMEGLDSQLDSLSMPATPSATPTSSGKAKAKGKSEADELRELEAAMAL
eukprot:TRINITY_DN320_c0_g1_i9.p4 TRINITY_DN320_c0_g1~~TRINITY_DN320_c0_g1_i9.p4  ORF type:complete len:115 (-),score=52.55 TRINITY_DN320_c0_g1_i9:975-1319(-)